MSPRLREFANWEKIEEVEKKLDAGESTTSISKWCCANGFKISMPLLNTYASIRRCALLKHMSMAAIMKQDRKPGDFDFNRPSDLEAGEKLLSEIDLLDTMISKGKENICSMDPEKISIRTTMDAIKLKQELTGGSHGLLTPHGVQSLKETEAGKYAVIIDYLMQFIPENLREDALAGLPAVEEAYYRGTPWYDQYRRSVLGGG